MRISNSLIILFAAICLALGSCAAECQTCTDGGDPNLQNPGMVCPEDFESTDDFDKFITQHEVSGGECD